MEGGTVMVSALAAGLFAPAVALHPPLAALAPAFLQHSTQA